MIREDGIPDYLHREEITFNTRLILPFDSRLARRIFVGFTWHPSVIYGHGSLLGSYGGDVHPKAGKEE